MSRRAMRSVFVLDAWCARIIVFPKCTDMPRFTPQTNHDSDYSYLADRVNNKIKNNVSIVVYTRLNPKREGMYYLLLQWSFFTLYVFNFMRAFLSAIGAAASDDSRRRTARRRGT